MMSLYSRILKGVILLAPACRRQCKIKVDFIALAFNLLHLNQGHQCYLLS